MIGDTQFGYGPSHHLASSRRVFWCGLSNFHVANIRVNLMPDNDT